MGISSILIIGNGQLSYSIVEALSKTSSSENGTPPKISVLTNPYQTPWLPPNTPPNLIEHKTSDFSASSLESSFTGQDLVISTLAGGDYNFQVGIIDAVIVAGVKRFIPHEFGLDSLNQGIQAILPRSAERARIIQYLRDLSRTHLDFQWVGIAVGCVLDRLLIAGDLGFDLQWQNATIHGTGTEILAASSLQRVGSAVASCIEHWHEMKNRYIYTAGVLTTANDILACLEHLSGKKWSFSYEDVGDCVREGTKRIERGYPDAGMFLMERSVVYDGELKAAGAFEKKSANKILGLDEETVEQIVAKAYHDFQHHGRPGCGCG
ncbi:isoflavone reductase family protein [Clohesyomyces aquaticus]|uniref:Isoflavone reductase family protein n=1 Tax=Clohesyomyces aquaticus TaxID=1231657 RepID=A0A1Y1Z820_9PLEO|nr:isoflavone reductase family protein [Clohesyomyces aquaticus]